MIFNYGSLNIDYVYNVTDFVRGGETISSHCMSVYAGGKGLNQSVALARAGAAVSHCGYLGENAGFLQKILVESGVNLSLLRQVPQTNGHAIIQVDKAGQNCILLYGGTNLMQTDDYICEVANQIVPGDTMLFQNECANIGQMMRVAKQCGAMLVLNPSPMDSACLDLPLDLVDIFILNEVEGEAITGETKPERIADSLRVRYQSAEIVLTLGKHGVLYDGEGTRFRLPICDMGAPVDTTAAGDTFTGYFIALKTQGESNLRAAEIASKAAGIAVTKQGAAPSIPTRDEVIEY